MHRFRSFLIEQVTARSSRSYRSRSVQNRLRRRSKRNFLAIRAEKVMYGHVFATVLGSVSLNLDLFTRVQRVSVPAKVRKVIWRGHLHAPVLDIPLASLTV